MEALLIMLLSYGTHTISIYLLLGQQDLRVVLACQWPATGLLRSTAALPTHNSYYSSRGILLRRFLTRLRSTRLTDHIVTKPLGPI